MVAYIYYIYLKYYHFHLFSYDVFLNRIICQSFTFNLCETIVQAQIPPLSGVSERCAVNMLHQLRQCLGEEGQVDFVPDVVLGPLEQVQQGLQEGTQLWMAEGKQTGQKVLQNYLMAIRSKFRFCSEPIKLGF